MSTATRLPLVGWRIAACLAAASLLFAASYAVYPVVIHDLLGLRTSAWDELWRTLLLNVSMAMGVGAIIEVFASHYLIDAASREIAARVLAAHLPEGFRARIAEVVHNIHVVREDWSAEYFLEQAEKPEFVRVVLSQRYTATNYSDRPQTYQPLNAEDFIYQPVFTDLEVVHRGRLIVHDIKEQLNDISGACEVVGPKLKLAPKGRDGSSCTVYWRLEMTAPHEYTHVLAFGGATIDPRISASTGGAYVFEAGRDHVEAPSKTNWQYRRAYLGGDHLRVWWRPVRGC